MNILIDKVRIKNFRSLKDIEISLQPVTLLVGANNSGKTTFLQALNIALGINKIQITKDDLFIDSNGNQLDNKIITIDIRIVSTNDTNEKVEDFIQPWLGIFGSDANQEEGYFAFRTEITFINNGDKYQIKYYFLKNWENPTPQEGDILTSSVHKRIQLYFLDAQRDLEQDTRLRSSYFGRLAVQLEKDYDKEQLRTIKDLVQQLNSTTIDNSSVLTHLKGELSKLNRTTNTTGEGVSLTPFPMKVRDLHKGMKVNFQDNGSDIFSLEYHGMGARSWASILSFSAFIAWESKQQQENSEGYFPILALEEPEAHLHPNAQRTLYQQLKKINGQKIISTHSPFIVGQANLEEIRHFRKLNDEAKITQVYLSDKDEARIGELLKEIESAGATQNINRQNRPIIEKLLLEKRKKLNTNDVRKIRREVLNTRGELLFSKAIILFEGETEEQALPIFAKSYFGCYPFELGINFIGVGGKDNYAPFLKLAKFLDIPWYILSDGDGNTEIEVKQQIESSFGNHFDNLKVLPNNADFEKFLVDEGFKNQLTIAINQIEGENYFPNQYIDEQNGQRRKGNTLKKYKNTTGQILANAEEMALIDCLRENKTKFAEYIATEIIKRKDENENIIYPSTILDLFKKIDASFNFTENETGTI